MVVHKPNFFIVGAPKSATTAMDSYLNQHPEVHMATKKELHYFGTDLNFLPPSQNFKTIPRTEDELRYYLSFFDCIDNTKATGESSVWYLHSQTAALEIKDFNPDAKVIIMLRNPVDLLYALHSEFLWDANEDIDDFMMALAAESARKLGRNLPKSMHFREGLYYREVIKFYTQVKRYLDVFTADQVLVLVYEDFAYNPHDTYIRVLEFLGVSTSFVPEFQRVNANKKVKNKYLHNSLWKPPRLIKAVGKLIPSSLRSKVIFQLRMLNTQYTPRPKLDPEDRSQLLQEFRPEIESLQELLQQDLSFWLSERN